MERCGNCKNCHKFLKERAAYMAAMNEHPNEGWEESWNAGKEGLENSLPCSVISHRKHCKAYGVPE
jgi:hypothetical protein